jgi:hypothetical protein
VPHAQLQALQADLTLALEGNKKLEGELKGAHCCKHGARCGIELLVYEALRYSCMRP